MQYIIDIVLIVIAVFVIIRATRKGFFLTLCELVSYIASIISAKLLSTTLATKLYEDMLYSNLKTRIGASIGSAGDVDISEKVSAALDSIPTQFDGVLEMIGINRAELVNSVSSSDVAGKTAIEVIMDKVINPVATAIVQTILFVVLAIVISVVLRFVVACLNKIIKKTPGIKQLNTGLGSLLGILKAVIIVVLLALLIGCLSGLSSSKDFVEAVNNSFILKGSNQLLDSISGYKFS